MGSEMCIRDSPCDGPVHPQYRGPRNPCRRLVQARRTVTAAGIARARPATPIVWAGLGIAMLTLAILAGIVIGETPLPPSLVGSVLANKLFGAAHAVDAIDSGIIWNYRMPRTLVAAACGAGLALAGVVLQSLVRNALADPYLCLLYTSPSPRDS